MNPILEQVARAMEQDVKLLPDQSIPCTEDDLCDCNYHENLRAAEASKVETNIDHLERDD